MSYTHLTKTELKFFSIGLKGRQTAGKLKRGHESIYRVIRQLKEGKTAIEIYLQYKNTNKNVDVNPSNFLKNKLNTSMRK